MKPRTVVLVVLLGCPSANAQETVGSSKFDGERLFTTASQREHLDALREGAPPPERDTRGRREAVVPVPEQSPTKKPPQVNLRGFIRRSNGASAVWVNGNSTLGSNSIAGDIQVESGQIRGRTVVITLPDGRQVRLEPGQIWDPKTERVVDDYRH